jgi:thiamine-monophosphate kinase
MANKQFLRDLGERRIVDELIKPRFPKPNTCHISIGDDCAVVPSPLDQELIVITTDPCPTPVICLLEPPDYYHFGRLSMLINISDIAAMGGNPIGIVMSTVMPEKMTVEDYERFLDGLEDASQEWSCPVLGGNIKDGHEFTATGTAFGAVHPELIMQRVGARPGDRVCVIGNMGFFWAAVVNRLMPHITLDTQNEKILENSIYNITARLQEGRLIAKSRSITSCMDSSDGVGSCLQELAIRNNVDILIESESLKPHPAVLELATLAEIDFRKIMLSWGNWELVCTVKPNRVAQVKSIIEGIGSSFYNIGALSQGTGKVWLVNNGQKAILNNFSSDRFSNSSYFTHGIDAYFDHLRNSPITI